MAHAKRERGRALDGILLLDKPLGLTSNAALQEVKRLFQARKAGHTGSLDPLATGLLPICFGEATKLTGYMLDADKRYRFTCRLGEITATGDAEGEILERRPVPALTEADIRPVLARFTGALMQTPPMYSAVKHQGQRLYDLAREGKVVAREPRPVTIHRMDLVDWQSPEMELDVRCSKGTYVRTLAEDIGTALGSGAHVSRLRRLGVGPFDEPEMHTLESLRQRAAEGQARLDASVLPLDASLTHLPEVRLTRDSAWYLKQGQPVQVPRAPTRGLVRVLTAEGQFLGVGEIDEDGRVAPRRLLQPPRR